MSLDLAGVARFVTPRSVLAETGRALRAFGAKRCEGLVLWLGHVRDTEAHVVATLVPPQNPIASEEGIGYLVGRDTLFHVNRLLSDQKLRLLAQVHSHPGRAYHSATDDAYAIVTTVGGFSLVVPNFASGPDELWAWAVYRLDPNGRWVELDSAKVAQIFQVR